MKKNIKIILLFLIISFIFISLISSVSAIDYSTYEPSSTGNSNKAITMAGNILGIIRGLGVAVGVIALTIIGVKYMLGSVEQKAEYKKSLIPFVIGIIILVAGTTIITTIIKLTQGW